MTTPHPAPPPPDNRLSPDGASFNGLMQAIVTQQDRTAFVTLYGYYAPRIKGYLMRLGAAGQIAEELSQETMLAVWRRAASFDPKQASLSTWIFTIARNRWIDIIRREQHPELTAEDGMMSDPEPEPDRIYEQNQQAEMVRSALKQLPPEQAELVKLAYFHDMAHGQIVETTGLPLGTVKSRLRLALEKLRRELKEWNSDDKASS